MQDAFDERLVFESFGFSAGFDLLKLRSGDADVHFGFVFFGIASSGSLEALAVGRVIEDFREVNTLPYLHRIFFFGIEVFVSLFHEKL